MKAVCKKLFSLMLVAILLVSAVPFQASAEEVNETDAVAVETTEAVEEAVEIEKIEATEAAADAAVDPVTPKVDVQFQLGTEPHYQIGETVNTRVGKKVSKSDFPSSKDALKAYAKAVGSSEGYEFVGWYLDTDYTIPFDNTIYINQEMDFEYPSKGAKILNVYAHIRAEKTTITLKPNGGTVSDKKHTVRVGQTYGKYGELPTPKRENYTFKYWALPDGTKVTDDTVVETLDTLTAKWSANKYTVSYEAYFNASGSGSSDWTSMDGTFGPFEVDANDVLKKGYGTIPTQEQKEDLFLSKEMEEAGWYIDGWMIKGTNRYIEAGVTKITDDIVIRPSYKKRITLKANDEGNTTKKFTVTLGERVGVLPNPGLRDGETFQAWYDKNGNLVSNVSNLSNVDKHPAYYPAMGNLEAEYVPATVFYLYIYTNGDTDDFTKRVVYYGAPAEGEFKMSDIDLYEIFPNYTKYDDKGDEQDGWFNETQWDKYCLGKPANELQKITLGEEGYEDDIYQFYIMLTDNGNNSSSSSGNNSNSGYNDNTATRDPSNPSTGDEIFVAVTVMALSAAALVLFLLNKKRITK